MIGNRKPSGVNWIKDIPNSWSTIKVKHLATDKNTLFLDGDWIESDVIEESGIRYLTTGNVGVGYYKEQGSGYVSEKTFKDLHCLKVLPNDLMVSRLNEPIGRACIVPNNESFYVVAVDNVIIRPNKNFNKKFLMYVMNTDGYAENGNIIARGATMSRVSRSQLGQFWITYTELSEQTLIADFLDEQCEKIESIITDLEKQIKILQKYKKSLVTEAVTKGLDKSEPMNDSGIDFGYQIKKKFIETKLKYLCNMFSGVNLTSDEIEADGEYPVYGGNGLRGYIDKFNVNGKHIIVGRQGALCGNVHLVNGKFWATDHAVVVYHSRNINVEYLFYLLEAMNLNKHSQTAAQPGLAVNMIMNLKTCIPQSVYEQNQIANYLEKQCTKIDSIIESKKEQLAKIAQHKKSLIYEYVTGRKRVKGESNNGN